MWGCAEERANEMAQAVANNLNKNVMLEHRSYTAKEAPKPVPDYNQVAKEIDRLSPRKFPEIVALVAILGFWFVVGAICYALGIYLHSPTIRVLALNVLILMMWGLPLILVQVLGDYWPWLDKHKEGLSFLLWFILGFAIYTFILPTMKLVPTCYIHPTNPFCN